MEKTIMTGDRIFGFRLAYGINLDLFGHEISKKTKDPERFDIVIFKYPDDESQLFIKRVIGLPGETVEIKDGKVYIDGSETPLDDSFIPGENARQLRTLYCSRQLLFYAGRQPKQLQGFPFLDQHLRAV